MRHAGLGPLRPQQRVQYYRWWKKYLLLKRTGWITFFLFFVFQLLRLSDKPLPALAGAAGFVCLFMFLVSGVWWAFLDCPRCGQTFRAWYQGEADYFGDECENCGLTGRDLSSIPKPRK